MKRLTCEMCGSTDLIKQDGVFVCQSCGCKYSVEEARKMMVEGTVEIQGTVTVDNTASVENYLANARRAKEKEDWEKTEKYYNLVEQNDPDHVEAVFYSAYSRAMATLSSDDTLKREAAFEALAKCVSVIEDHYTAQSAEENREAILSVAADIGKMINSSFVYTKTTNGYGVSTTDVEDTYGLFRHLIMAFTKTMTNIMNVDYQPFLYDAAIGFCDVAVNTPWLQPGYNVLVQGHINDLRAAAEAHREQARQAYWAEHPEEKAALDAEKAELERRIEELTKQRKSVPEYAAYEQTKSELFQLRADYAMIRSNIFKGKERKALQEKIDQLEAALPEAKQRSEQATESISLMMNQLLARKAEVEAQMMNAV